VLFHPFLCVILSSIPPRFFALHQRCVLTETFSPPPYGRGFFALSVFGFSSSAGGIESICPLPTELFLVLALRRSSPFFFPPNLSRSFSLQRVFGQPEFLPYRQADLTPFFNPRSSRPTGSFPDSASTPFLLVYFPSWIEIGELFSLFSDWTADAPFSLAKPSELHVDGKCRRCFPPETPVHRRFSSLRSSRTEDLSVVSVRFLLSFLPGLVHYNCSPCLLSLLQL